jgi:TPR repeat protein
VRLHRLNRQFDSALAALSALGTQELRKRGKLSLEAAAADNAAATSSSAVTAAAPRQLQSGQGVWMSLDALAIRETFTQLSVPLLRSLIPPKILATNDVDACSEAVNEAAKPGKSRRAGAVLCLALCYADGFGRFPRDRARARELFEQLQERLPLYPWPAVYHAALLLVEAQERAFPPGRTSASVAGGDTTFDLAHAAADLRLHDDCKKAVQMLQEAWEKHHPAPVPLLLARCHLHGIGTPLDVGEAVKWLSIGAMSGDPQCSTELARYLLHTRDELLSRQTVDAISASRAAPPATAAGAESLAGPALPDIPIHDSAEPPTLPAFSRAERSAATVAALEPSLDASISVAVVSCLKHAAVYGSPFARAQLRQEYLRRGETSIAALWESEHPSPRTGGGGSDGTGRAAMVAATTAAPVASAVTRLHKPTLLKTPPARQAAQVRSPVNPLK